MKNFINLEQFIKVLENKANEEKGKIKKASLLRDGGVMASCFKGKLEGYEFVINNLKKLDESINSVTHADLKQSLTKLKCIFSYNGGDRSLGDSHRKYFKVIEQYSTLKNNKELALQVIVRKNVLILTLELCDTVEEYNDRMNINEYKLNKEEFDLIKPIIEELK